MKNTPFFKANVLRLPAFLISFLAFCASAFSQESGWPLIRNYTPEEYGFSSQVFCVAQSNEGLMYFGIPNIGAMEYDGLRWREIFTPNKTTIFDFSKGADGRIYAASTDDFGYLDPDGKGNTVYKSLIPNLKDTSEKTGAVLSVKSAEKSVYFLTFAKIYEYAKGSGEIKIFEADTNGRFLGAFLSGGAYHVRLSKKGLMKIEGGRMEPAPGGVFFKDRLNFVHGAAEYGGGKTLIATRTEGVFLYDPASGAAPAMFMLPESEFLSGTNLYTAFGGDGYFVLGSKGKGALLTDASGKALQRFDENRSLQNNGLLSIGRDPSRNLWLGLDVGVSKTPEGGDITYWGKGAGLKGTVLTTCRFNGAMYIGTNQGLYFIDPENNIKEVPDAPRLQNWKLETVQTPDGPRLFLANQLGIYEIAGGRATPVYKTDNHALFLLQSKKDPGRLFTTVGISGAVSLRFDGKKWVEESKIEGLKAMIRGAVEDAGGNLWLGSRSDGVFKVVFGADGKTSLTNYTEKEGLPGKNGCIPNPYKGGIVWSTEQGLYSYDPKTDRFAPFCDLGQMLCGGEGRVSRFKEAGGKVYIAPNSNKTNDVGYLSPNGSSGYDWMYKPFRRLPPITEITALHIDSPGVVWVGGVEGLFRYDPSLDRKDYAQKFSCLIREVAIGEGKYLYGGGDLRQTPPTLSDNTRTGISYEDNTLKFLFAAPFFDNEERTLYSYKLEGFDESWSAWGRQTEKEYTNLYEGDYTFLAKAKNIYDVESSVGSFAFSVLPPWYRTWWAYCLYAALFGLSIYGTVKWNTRRLIQEKERLEKTVLERTEEIRQQKEEISAQADNLKTANFEISQQKEEIEVIAENLKTTNLEISAKNAQITDSIRYARTIQVAILPNPKIMGKHLDHFVFFQPKDIVSGDFYWFTHLNTDQGVFDFIAAVDCTGHGVPGAFMSMIGYSVLNEVVKEKKIIEPSRILDYLDFGVRLALRQEDKANEDGMDVALARIEKKEGFSTIVTAGAKRPAYLFRDNNMEEIKGSKRSIGGLQLKQRDFEQETTEITGKSVLFLFTDGFADQTSPDGKKMGSPALLEMLQNNAMLPCGEQGRLLGEAFNAFKGDAGQKDDVTVIGIAIAG